MSSKRIVINLADSGERIEKDRGCGIYHFYDKDNNLVYEGYCFRSVHDKTRRLWLNNGTVYYPDLGVKYFEFAGCNPTSINELIGFDDSDDLTALIYNRVIDCARSCITLYDRNCNVVRRKVRRM